MKKYALFALLICTAIALKAQDFEYSNINLDTLQNISIITFKEQTFKGKFLAQRGDTFYIITAKRDVLMVTAKDIKAKNIYLPKVRPVYNEDKTIHYGVVFKGGILPIPLFVSGGAGFEFYLNQTYSIQMTYNYSQIGVDAPSTNHSLIPEVRRYSRAGLKTYFFNSAFIELNKNEDYTGEYCQEKKYLLLENRKSVGLGVGLGIRQQLFRRIGVEAFAAIKYKYSNLERLYYTGRQITSPYCGDKITEYDTLFHHGYRLGFNFIFILN